MYISKQSKIIKIKIKKFDIYLYIMASNGLNNKMFLTDSRLKTTVDGFFNSKAIEFYSKDICSLQYHWQQVVKYNINYID